MGAFTLTEHDGELLSFLADHRAALAAQLAIATGLTELTVRRRLRALLAAGLISERRVLHRQPAAYLITERGLRTTGSPLHARGLNLQGYVHDLGAAWLWLAARDGAFGPVDEVLSERQLRSRDGLPRPGGDAPADGALERWGVRQFGLGPGGAERLHYPDLLLETNGGRRVALELELTGKSRRRLEGILAGYGADPRVDAVVYVVADDRLEAKVRRAAARAGASDKVFVRRFSWTPSMRALADQLGHASSRARNLERGRDRGTSRNAEVTER